MRCLRSVAILLGFLVGPAASAQFIYQGELRIDESPLSGQVDLIFELHDAPTGGAFLTTQAFAGVDVEDGRFTVALDLDPPALGSDAARFIQIQVREAGIGSYTALAPRVPLRPAPYAITTRHVRDDGVDAAAISASAVGSDAVSVDAATSASFANESVTTAQLAGSAVAGSDIADATLTAAKFGIAIPSSVTAVQAGTGLGGGAAAGSTTLNVDDAQVQRRVASVCPLGETVSAFRQDGSVQCEPLPGATLVTTVQSAGDVGMYSQIVISHGLPVLAFRVGVSTVRLIRCGNRACSASAGSTELNNFNGGLFIDLATDPDDDPLVAWRRDGAGLTFVRCNSADCDNPLIVNQLTQGTHPSVGHPDGGTLGVPVLVYAAESGISGDLLFARCGSLFCTDGFAPSEAIDVSGTKLGAWNAVAFDLSFRPLISYYVQDSGSLRFARCSNAQCSVLPTPVVIDAPAAADVGTYSDIALSLAGQPMISYHDATNGTLRYALCLVADCSGTIIRRTLDDPSNQVGSHTSIARGSDNMPIISYYDATAGNLKVAHCSNTACNPATGTVTITTVDDGGGNDVGQWSSIAIGDDGLPVISYYDATAGDLKVARCGNVRCD
jgi:hypothetical protein